MVDYGDALDQHGAGQVGEADVGQYEVVGLGQQLLPLTQGIEDHQIEEDTGDIAAFRRSFYRPGHSPEEREEHVRGDHYHSFVHS